MDEFWHGLPTDVMYPDASSRREAVDTPTLAAIAFHVEPQVGNMGRLPASTAASAARTETAP